MILMRISHLCYCPEAENLFNTLLQTHPKSFPYEQSCKKGETEDQQSPVALSYLWFDIILILVVVKLLALEHEVPLLPVLDNGALLFQPADLQGPL